MWLAAVALVAFWGCAQSTATNSASPPPSHPDTASPAPPPPTVEILSWDQTQKRREQFRGKVVVLDVWSTSCAPCVREFPNLVALQERFGDRVVCISFNTDYSGVKDQPPESFRQPVLKFLAAQNARLFNVISSDVDEDFYNRIHLGGPPAVFVYDRDGKLVKRFDNSHAEFGYKRDVIPLVEKLIGK